MRLLKTVLVLGVLAALVVGFFAFVQYGPHVETFVEIAPGTGTVGIAKQLQKAGIVRSAFAFEALKVAKSLSGRGAGTLKAGEYRFDRPATVDEVYNRLRRGDVYTVTLVIPEGFNIFDIASAVAEAKLDTRDDFLRAEQKHTELIAEWSPQARSLEGFLFPDTYKFGRHATALQMLTAMVRQFGQEMGSVGLSGMEGRTDGRTGGSSLHPTHDDGAVMNGAPDSGRSGEGAPGRVMRVVTMASLVEREVHIDAERPVVAGVFENRLAEGMPLQTDPAVVYASLLRGTWTGVIHESELRSDSEYNTYTHAGLPPGPICNPGVAALRAALHPAKTDYLYFVASAQGATRFAATLAQHNANVTAYRAGR